MRALFICNSETRGAYAGSRSYKLNAVTPQAGDEIDPEAESFWTATPQGNLEITITNPEAYLTIGQRYYLDFTPHAVRAPDPVG